MSATSKLRPEVAAATEAAARSLPPVPSPAAQVLAQLRDVIACAVQADRRERLVDLAAVIDRVGIGKSTIWLLISANDFPRPVQASPGALRWKESEIDNWISSREVAFILEGVKRRPREGAVA